MKKKCQETFNTIFQHFKTYLKIEKCFKFVHPVKTINVDTTKCFYNTKH